METITDLQPQKRNKDRLNVFIDGEYAFSVNTKLGSSLKVGQNLTTDEVNKIKGIDTFDKAKQMSFRYLSYRPRSTVEVRNYLNGKGFDPMVIDRVVDQLINRDYLDDVEFTRYWIEQRQAHRPRGVLALRNELLKKGVPPTLIDAAVDEVDEKDAALRAIERKTGRWAKLPKQQFRRKISGFLERRGFSYAIIYEVAETAWLSLEEGH
ncbi:MAG: RecX family transcriptional regulator [Candidatus Promineifilaceae bacterium]